MKKLITKLALASMASVAFSMNAMAWHNDPLGHDRFSEGLLAVEDIEHEEGGGGDAPGHGKWGFKDKTGKLVISYQYENARDFSEGLAPVDTDKGIGFIDHAGKLVIKPNPDFAGLTHEINRIGFFQGLSVMGKILPPKNKDEDSRLVFGYINKKGAWVIKPQFESAWDFTAKGVATVKADGVEYEIDTSGKIAGNPVVAFQDEKTEKSGCRNLRSGKVVVKAIYDEVTPFSEGLAAVKSGEKWGYIDSVGKVIIKPSYEEVNWFSEGRAAVRAGEKWGYVDATGKMVVNTIYEQAKGFSEGLAAVKVEDKWGFIDKNGAMVIQPQFISEYGPESFSEGTVRVEVNGKTIYIDKTGKEVVIENNYASILNKYDDSRGFNDGVALVMKNDQYFVIDTEGKVLFRLY